MQGVGQVYFKDKSHEEFDLLATSLGRRKKGEEQVEVYEIPYSDCEFSVHTGKYKFYNRSMEFMINDNSQRGKIYKWLNGYGKLRTEIDPGGYFKAEIIQMIESEKLAGLYDKILVTFKINPPFFYLDSGDNPIVLTSAQTINNPGTHTSDPMMRIMGNGNATVSINGRIMVFQNIETFLDIDPDIIPAVYKNNENVGEKMVGDLPYLDLGLNEITWSGNIEQINILPRWRNL